MRQGEARDRVEVHVHVHPDPIVPRMLGMILAKLGVIQQGELLIMSDVSGLQAGIDSLKVSVENNTTVDASALALIQGFSAQLAAAVAAAQAAGATPDQLAALTSFGSTIDASSSELAAAVAANTSPPA